MDFSAMSFQDAKDLIDKDENERLKFMNSNVTFSDGIEQMEAPSLLSITNYFQQGSSFPVPYVGNDSTMMSAFNDNTPSQKRMSSSSHNVSGSRKVSFGGTKELTSPTRGPSDADKSGLARNDSLAQFFLDSKSDGMNKMDMMEYVLNYCKRRSSIRLSDASDITSSSDSKNTTPERHDSGIGIGKEENARKKSKSEKQDPKIELGERPFADLETKPTNSSHSILRNSRIVPSTLTSINENDASVIIADATTVQEKELSDVSEVGSIDGFEKFKKNLSGRGIRHHNEDRYRSKIKHHEQFEKKRLKDEQSSHPKLSKQVNMSTPRQDPPKESNREADSRESGKMKARSEKREGERPLVDSDSRSSTSSGSREKVKRRTHKISNNLKDKEAPVASSNETTVKVNNTQTQDSSSQAYTVTCPHPYQCIQQQQPGPPGMMPSVGVGMPIVIHIHLPYAPSGTVVHPVPTSTNENHKM